MRKSKKPQTEDSVDSSETFKYDSKAFRKSKVVKEPKQTSLWDEIDFNQNTSEILRYAEVHRAEIMEIIKDDASDDQKTDRPLSRKSQDHKELWDFFGKFENQSNPDLSLGQLDQPIHREPQPYQRSRSLFGENSERRLTESKPKKNLNKSLYKSKPKQHKLMIQSYEQITFLERDGDIPQAVIQDAPAEKPAPFKNARKRIIKRQEKKQESEQFKPDQVPHSESHQRKELPPMEQSDDRRYPLRRRLPRLRFWMGQKPIYKDFKIVDIRTYPHKKD